MTRSPKPRKPTRKAETVLREFTAHAAGTFCPECERLLRELRQALKQTKERR